MVGHETSESREIVTIFSLGVSPENTKGTFALFRLTVGFTKWSWHFVVIHREVTDTDWKNDDTAKPAKDRFVFMIKSTSAVLL